jgi:putative FmdB family regulatory protein
VPIYVYECEQCGERFEYHQSLSEPPKTVCEKCAGKLEKIIAPTAFHLKGGGWYKDLYAKPKSGGGGGGEAKSSTESKTESKPQAETKTESKTESKPAGSDK